MKKRIIKYLLNRFTDYYQVKEDNSKLKNDIKILIEEPCSEKSLIVIGKHLCETQLSHVVWAGDVGRELKHFEGLSTIVSNQTI